MPGPGGIGQPNLPAGTAMLRGGDNQTAVVYDLLSEGNIEGLKDGFSSIYFNGTPIIDPNSAAYKSLKSRRGTCTTTANSATVTVSSGLAVNEIDLTDGTRIIHIMGAGDLLTGNGSSTGVTTTKNNSLITTTASFFDSTDATTTNSGLGNVYVRIPGAGYDGQDYFGKITHRLNATEAHVSPPVPTAVSYKTIVKDLVTTINSITNSTTIVVADAADTAVTGTKCIISPPKVDNTERLTEDGFNFEHVSAFFRTGHQHQAPPESFAGQVGTTYAKSFSQEIKQTTNPALSITGQDVIIKTALADMDIVDPGEIDSLRITMEFSSLIRTSKNTANEYPARVEFQIWFEYYQGGTWKNTAVPIYGVTDEAIKSRQYNGHATSYTLANKVNYGLGEAGAFNSGVVNHQTKSKYLYEFPIDIEKYKPFTNFRVRIKRVTGNELLEHTKYQNNHQSRLNSIYAFVHDRQNFAHSAYAGVTFQASEFSSVPTRAYECRGLKIQVPTNYLTREEVSGVAASYKRNISTGATASTDQAWDGKFRGDISDTSWRTNPTHVNYGKVYCNNPAWVYYDIMTNNRYGLGEFLKAENVDKYSLYSIARYCDELVPDGEGGTEPRFTCNLYLSTKKEAFKVLTEMASIFRGMLYWMDSNATLIMDRPKEPIYTFTKSNVVAGDFQYQSSSLRMRTNQVNVTWNDPTRFYKQYVEAVDDVDDIIDTGKVIPKNIIAMGCTSQGQANRMGRWTLLTEKLEPEIVTFKTGINAGFLKVGDLIYVQDKADSGVTASGRVSNTGTRSSTVIPLDRTVTLESGDTYDLHLIYPKGGAYLNEDGPLYISDASTTKYQRGDLITSAKLASNINTAVTIDTEEEAANLIQFGTPYTALKTYWSPYSRVETQRVSAPDNSSSDASASSLTTSAFTGGAPNTEVMWALTNVTSANTAKGARKFRIQSVAETEDLTYEIAAQYYDDQKFNAIDRGYGTYQRNYEPLPLKDERVPFVNNLSVKFEPIASTTQGSTAEEDVTSLYNAVISWQTPYNEADNTLYDYLHSYDLLHNITPTGNNSPIISISPNVTTFTVSNVVPGNYKIAVRVRSTINQVGQWREISQIFASTEKASGVTTLPKTAKLKHGGALTTTISLENTDQVTLGSANYNVTSPTGKVIAVSSGTTTYDFGTAGLQSGETGYLLWDDSASSWKMVENYSDTTALNAAGTAFSGGINYWKEIATGSAGLTRVTAGNDALATVTTTETRNSETISEVGTSISVGTIKTKLNNEFSQGDFIKLGTGTTAWYGTVKSLSSPHYFNPSVTVSTSNDTINIPNNSFITNEALYYQRDGNTLIAGLTDNTLYYVIETNSLEEVFKLSTSSGGSAIDLTGTGNDANQYLQSATATITTNEPIYKAFDGSGADAYIYKLAFVPDFENDFLYAKVVNTSGSYAITVLGTQPGTQGAAGATGTDAYTVRLTANKYAIAYNIDGGESDTITMTAAPQGIQGTATYKFDLDGTTKQSASTTATYAIANNDEPASGSAKVVKVTMYDDGVEKATDSVSVYGIQDGEDAITVIMTNEAHALPTTSGGSVAYDNSGTDIKIFKGSTALAYGSGNSQFTVSAAGTTSSIQPHASPTTVSTYTRRYGVANTMATATAIITFTITVKNALGTTTTFTKIQTFNKTVDGAAGNPGGTGAAGLRTIQGYLYYEDAASPSTAPTAPSYTTYTFSTGDINGGSGAVEVLGLSDTSAVNKWTNQPRPNVATSANTFWTVRYFGTEASAEASTITIAYSNVVKQTSFTGVVTFSGGTLTDGSSSTTPLEAGDLGASGTTTIDGGRITTGYLAAARIQANSINISTFTNNSGFTDDTTADSKTTAVAAAAAANSAAKNAGSVGGLTLTSTKMYIGTGTVNNANTGFYVDSSGNFSLKDKLYWNGTTLVIDGEINLTNASTVLSDLNVASGATANQTDSEALTASNAGANSQEKTGGKVGGLSLASDKMYIGTGTINNANTAFYVDNTGKMSLKDKLYWDGTTLAINGNGTFTGDISGASGTLTNNLSVGSNNTIFKATSTGIQLGHATFGSAPFRVSAAGALTASSATITGAITASSGSIADGVTVGSGDVAASTVVTGSATGTTVGGYFSSGVLTRAAGGLGVNSSGASGVPYVVNGGGFQFETKANLENANVTTYEIDYAGFSGSWTNISGQIEPAAVSFAITITWRNGVGTSLGTTVITLARNSGGTALIAAVTTSNGASATVSLGGAVSSGVIQATTVTKNSVPVILTAMITDGSGWGFK